MQHPQAEAGRLAQQALGTFAGFVEQAKVAPGSDTIPTTAARAIQGRR